MSKKLLVTIGLLLLFAIEILRVYFIMPFPGSQHSNTIHVAYFLDRNVLWLRIIALLITIPALWYYLSKGRAWQKILLIFFLGLYGMVFYMFNFRFLAEKMFYQPKEKLFASAPSDSTDKNKLVIGVSSGDDSKAYPIEIIGYHHQVRDTLNGQAIMVTYCTVCRTGRVYNPSVNGRNEQFRLVGMDHFNAMFEDATTKSWWQQATGKAIAGKLQGMQLAEIPSAQMRLEDWLALHPGSKVLQPDSNFRSKYDSLKGYDEGIIESGLEKRDSASWQFKSWIVGIILHDQSRAYDWNQLLRNRVIQDTIGGSPVLITIEANNKTFYSFIPDDSLHLSYDASTQLLKDAITKTTWQLNGLCIDGSLKGHRLATVQAYQEFWHSWRTFHPTTSTYQHTEKRIALMQKPKPLSS
jgi:Protein of unknown function (DUF3179)